MVVLVVLVMLVVVFSKTGVVSKLEGEGGSEVFGTEIFVGDGGGGGGGGFDRADVS